MDHWLVFGVCYIRVFVSFLDDPYHEPLLWFMIIHIKKLLSKNFFLGFEPMSSV